VHYNFTAEQIQIADEMMSPEYYTLFAELLGVDILGGADLTQIRSNLPHGTKGADIVEAALTRLGHPYSQKYRGSKNYVDCSYLAYWAYKQAGVNIPSTSVTQAKYCYDNGYNVGKSELQPGDLIFWSKLSCNCGRWKEIHHVGIYIGDGKTIEASSSSGCVVVRDIWGENGATWRIHSYARPYV
jgi:cell wall-associated NlpC family hydrolase